MQILQYALSFVIAIGVLVTVHEFGHFWVARRLGVKVLRFSVGFGRPLWTYRSGPDGTEYVLAAIPLGGYVKMLDESEGHVPAADLARAFNRQAIWKRCAVVVAGPLANFLFAIAAYALTFLIGVGGLRAMVGEVHVDSVAARAGLAAGQQIVAVDGREVATWEAAIHAILGKSLDRGVVELQVASEQGRARVLSLDLTGVGVDDLTRGQFFDTLGIEPARPALPARIGELEGGGRAAQGGLKSGDRVLEADGTPMTSWSDWVVHVRARPEQPMRVLVERDGARYELVVTPARESGPTGDFGRIGAGPADSAALLARFYVTERLSPPDAIARGFTKTLEMSSLTLRLLWRMLLLEVSVENLSGPISIAQYAGVSAEGGLTRFVDFLAIVSISLGLLNLLPVPLLDGGHLLYYLAEAVRGRPLSEEVQFAGQRLGIALLVGLMGLAFYNDLSRLLG